MATLTVRNLDEALIRALCIRAAEHGRSAEAEHRAILQQALTETGSGVTRATVAERLEAFRRRTTGRGSAKATELLRESREDRVESCWAVPAADGWRWSSTPRSP